MPKSGKQNGESGVVQNSSQHESPATTEQQTQSRSGNGVRKYETEKAGFKQQEQNDGGRLAGAEYGTRIVVAE